LVQLGVEVDVFMPKYRGMDESRFPLEPTGVDLEITLNAKPVAAGVRRLRDSRGPRCFFLECDPYFDREYLYGTPESDYEDNAERFVFLCRAAIEWALASGTHYDVFHSHDWQSALTSVYLRTLYAGEPLLFDGASVFTIHNLGYQGIFWHLDMPLVGVGWEFFTPKHMEFHGKLNFLKSGIVFSDEVNTVSAGYRDEILTPEFGFGLEGVLQEKGERLTGILNGVDYNVWNPALDEMIAQNYSPEDLSGKAACKADLQKAARFPARPDVAIVGMVSRLSSQKGIDILGGIVPSLMNRDVQIVVLGTGEVKYHSMFREFGEKYPEKCAAFLEYDYTLSHKLFAGCDILVVPSRYEPCGLTQLYALKYGTVPVVRATGGLRDTVEEFNPDADEGTGFRFTAAEPSALDEAVSRALDVFHGNKPAWTRLMTRGMRKDYSWSRSAKEYEKLYLNAISERKRAAFGK
jgi:starch synthase